MTSFYVRERIFWAVTRLLNLPALLEKKSHFLLGPRQTGKTCLIAHTLPGVRTYDLLDTSVYLLLSRDPGRMEQELEKRDLAVSDEELARRKAAYVQPEPNVKSGWLARYARMVASANLGAVMQ